MSKRRIELGLAEAALLFAALGDETRLALVRQLSGGGPSSISALARNFQISRQAVTKHLQSLSQAGIIAGRRDGRERIWSLNPDRLEEAQRCLQLVSAGWDDALERLKRQIEGG